MTRSRRRGRLVAIEGIDGAGKSTLARALAARLRRDGRSVTIRREPTDRRLGALAQAAGREDPWTGAVYFTIDRQTARPDLERALARFDVVLTDRSYFSTLAYQGSALAPAQRRRLEELQTAVTVRPDRVLLVDLDPGVAVTRLARRARARGPLERRRTLERVARSYRALARERRWPVLDGELAPRALVDAAYLALGRPPARAPRRRRPTRT
jgi:dTMP kinase